MRRRGIDEIIAECEARGPASCELIVEHIRSEYPEISDHEILAAIKGAIERTLKHDLAMVREHNAEHPEEPITAEDLAAMAPDLAKLLSEGSGPRRRKQDGGEAGEPR